MKLGQKLVYILILILASSSSMASVDLVSDCSDMPSMMKTVGTVVTDHSMHEMPPSNSEIDCCESSSCPMSHCAGSNIALTNTPIPHVSPQSHYVLIEYSTRPELLVINSHYRPPISLLS